MFVQKLLTALLSLRKRQQCYLSKNNEVKNWAIAPSAQRNSRFVFKGATEISLAKSHYYFFFYFRARPHKLIALIFTVDK